MIILILLNDTQPGYSNLILMAGTHGRASPLSSALPTHNHPPFCPTVIGNTDPQSSVLPPHNLTSLQDSFIPFLPANFNPAFNDYIDFVE